jgi:anti-sigma regulatory factor (Ser/Thr protein kinase)
MWMDPSPEALVLPSSLQAPAIARDHASRLAAGWPPELLDEILLVVSEAVTNAVRYGHGQVELAILVTPDRVRIEVSDGNPQPPRKRGLPDGLADGGRGLHLIDALADTWGTRPRADRPGKTVWLEVTRSQRAPR